MTTIKQTEDEFDVLIHDKGWKGKITLGILALILWALISSTLFVAIKTIIEIGLVLGGILLICYGGYLYFQQKK